MGIAKNQNNDDLPELMSHNGIIIPDDELQDALADFFENKIETLVRTARIDQGVYNGYQKMQVDDQDFMTPVNVLIAMKSLKIKNCEGSDQIPQRIIADGLEILHEPFTKFFAMIYRTKTIPEQWKMAKIMTVDPILIIETYITHMHKMNHKRVQ